MKTKYVGGITIIYKINLPPSQQAPQKSSIIITNHDDDGFTQNEILKSYKVISWIMAPPKRASSSSISPPAKRKAVSIGSSRNPGISLTNTNTKAQQSSSVQVQVNNTIGNNGADDKLRQEFIDLLTQPQYEQNGITNSQLKSSFIGERYVHLVPIINALTQEARLIMSKTGDELVYKIISEEKASKFEGLDIQARMVYQIIEESGNQGIWKKHIREKSKIPNQTLLKIYKNLEARKLIKPLPVNAKKEICYMVYDLQPSKEITGGPW